jgi:NADPH:quinone reductase-like Zn-dependent oxidoreductase
MQMAASKVLGNRVGGLQKYAIAIPELTALIPPGVSFEEAATVPITATTSLAAFHTLSLPWPTASGREGIDEPILVWGGGSGVGRTTIAFLRLAGYKKIITTAAIKREDELKSIGATVVVDHRDKHVVEKLINALPGYTVSKAIDAISNEGTTDSINKLMKNGGKVARSLPVPESEAGKYQGLELAMVNCSMFHDASVPFPIFIR